MLVAFFVAFRLLLATMMVAMLIGFSFSPPSPSQTASDIQVPTQPSPKVKVLVCVESLCIDSKRFVLNQLLPAYQLLGSEVIDLEVVVYGNAQMDVDSKTIQCQHGEAECDANIYEQCVISLYPHAYRYLPFLGCLFTDLTMGRNNERFDTSFFSECARESALDSGSIQNCHDDPNQAWKLQVMNARRTPQNHDHVPWVEINGLRTIDEDHDDFVAAVCGAYQRAGGRHPACTSSRSGALSH